MGLFDTMQGAGSATDAGDLARRLGKMQDAERWYGFALQAMEKRFGEQSPEAEAAKRRLNELRAEGNA